MSPSLAKKQKTSNSIHFVFTTSHGTKPDASFQVFTKQLHVSSMALKMNATFIQKRLDPVHSQNSTTSSPLFTSEWPTEVDKEGTWALSSHKNFQHRNISGFKGDPTHQENAFEKFLLEVYNRPYQVTDSLELNNMVIITVHYGVFYILFNSFYTAIRKSPGLIETMMEDPCSILVSATKVRNEALFKDNLILLIGSWSKPRYLELADPDLLKLAATCPAKMYSKVVETHLGVLQVFSKSDSTGRLTLCFIEKTTLFCAIELKVYVWVHWPLILGIGGR